MRSVDCGKRAAIRVQVRFDSLPGNSFRLTLVDFFHTSLHFSAELGDLFLCKTVKGHLPHTVRDDFGGRHFGLTQQMSRSSSCMSGERA